MRPKGTAPGGRKASKKHMKSTNKAKYMADEAAISMDSGMRETLPTVPQPLAEAPARGLRAPRLEDAKRRKNK